MGIDAEMVFTLDKEPTPELLRRIQYELMERFEKDFFSTTSYVAVDKAVAAPFLVPLAQMEYNPFDGPEMDVANGVAVRLWTRYYGPGYERGDALRLCGVMLYLLSREDVTGVYYGGDSSGVAGKPMTRQLVLALLDHFMVNGHHPYRGGYVSERDKGLPPSPLCSYCQVAMIKNGSGGRYAGFYCSGCGETASYHDDDYDRWIAGGDMSSVPRYNGVNQEKAGPFGVPVKKSEAANG